MKSILLSIIIQLTFVSNAFATEIKGTPEELRQFLHPMPAVISLTANVERRVYADQAIVSIVVKTEEKTLSKAMQENTKLRDSLRNNLVTEGVSEKDIQNSKFSSSPQFGWFGDEPKSFEVVNRVAVKINNEQALQALAAITDKHKEMSIAGTEFTHTTKDDVYQEMKKEAMAKILTNKTYYENTLKVTLKTRSFYDSGLETGTTNGELAIERIRVQGSRAKMSDLSSSYEAKPSAPSAQSFEEIQYNTNMRVEFEIVN